MPFTHTCKACNASFQSPRRVKPFCSRKCACKASSKRIERTCTGCGTVFSVPASRIKYSATLWCSASCRYATPGWVDTVNPDRKVDCTCQNCGKIFKTVASRNAKYCSKECLGASNGKRVHSTRQPDIEKQCLNCGNTFFARPAVQHRHKFCCRSCVASYHSRHDFNNRKHRIDNPTYIEKRLHSALSANNIDFTPEYQVGIYCVDIALLGAKLAIEADGDYWHSRADVKARDAQKDAYLQSKGWHVLRLTETEINASIEECLHRIREILSP